MDTTPPYGLSGDQESLTLLRDTLVSALRDHEDAPEHLWHVLNHEIGLGAVAVAERLGGLGGGAAEMWTVMETLGRSPGWTPYLATTVLGAAALRIAGGDIAERLLPRVAAGEIAVALAYLEPGRRNAPEPLVTTVVPEGSRFRINGAKVAVMGLAKADFVTFSAAGPDGGVTLFCIPADHAALSITPYDTLDGVGAADAVFTDMILDPADLVGEVGQGLPLLDHAIDEGTAAACAAACGTLRALVERTGDYCAQRRQFGKALAEFQVLQHQLVDMHLAAEQAASLAQLACAKLTAPAEERREAVSGAKYLVAEACRTVSQGAVQLHGGIGTTEELAISRYFRRALMLEHLFGGATYHLDRYRRARTSGITSSTTALMADGEER